MTSAEWVGPINWPTAVKLLMFFFPIATQYAHIKCKADVLIPQQATEM